MSEGSTYELFIPSELGYGDRSIPGIPAGSVLIFKVELFSVE
jgi:FKBP-type peptidyl-prolyl cis-trans isomerase